MRFLALYNGKTVSSAELLAVTADERILEDFGRRLLGDECQRNESVVREPPASERPTGRTSDVSRAVFTYTKPVE